MRPVSERFLRTIRGSHAMAARARIVTPGQTGTNPTGVEVGIIDGTVELDANADVRSTFDLTIPGEGMWPTRGNTLLAPYGTEVFIERGVQFGGGVTEWCSLGYFRIDSIEQDNPRGGQIRIAGSDRMASIVDAKLTEPRQYSATQTYGAVVADLVLDVLPWATIEWDDNTSSRPLRREVLVEEDRYAALRDLVDSVGKVAFWDHRGVLAIRTPPDPSVPVYEVTHGRDGVLVSMSRELSREGVYNAVVATGEGADTETPVRAVAYDNNPSSPTFWHGPFGKVPRFYSSPLITDETQARSAAVSLLRKQLGLPYSVSFGTVPNPALEPLDPVRVSYSDQHGRETHVIESMSIPLTADATMSAVTREKTLVIVGGL